MLFAEAHVFGNEDSTKLNIQFHRFFPEPSQCDGFCLDPVCSWQSRRLTMSGSMKWTFSLMHGNAQTT